MFDVTCEAIATEQAGIGSEMLFNVMARFDTEELDADLRGPLWYPADEEALDNLYFVPA